jgi:hypothetical protein
MAEDEVGKRGDKFADVNRPEKGQASEKCIR